MRQYCFKFSYQQYHLHIAYSTYFLEDNKLVCVCYCGFHTPKSNWTYHFYQPSIRTVRLQTFSNLQKQKKHKLHNGQHFFPNFQYLKMRLINAQGRGPFETRVWSHEICNNVRAKLFNGEKESCNLTLKIYTRHFGRASIDPGSADQNPLHLKYRIHEPPK